MRRTEKPTMTLHATDRIRRRGISFQTLELVLAEHDRCVPVGGGCEALQITHRRLSQMARDGYPSASADRAADVVVVFDPSTNTVITALKGQGTPHKRYRRRYLHRQRKRTGRRYGQARREGR